MVQWLHADSTLSPLILPSTSTHNTSTHLLGHKRPFPTTSQPQSFDYSLPRSSSVTYDHSLYKFLSLLTIPFHDQILSLLTIPNSNKLGHIRPFPTQAWHEPSPIPLASSSSYECYSQQLTRWMKYTWNRNKWCWLLVSCFPSIFWLVDNQASSCRWVSLLTFQVVVLARARVL